MMSVDATCCISRKCNYIFHYIKKIVHNDFNNFCNTMNKEKKKKNKARAHKAAALETRLRANVHIACNLIDMNIRYYTRCHNLSGDPTFFSDRYDALYVQFNVSIMLDI